MKRNTAMILALVAALLLAWTVLYTVDETQCALVTRFGNPLADIRQPGLHVKLPAPIDRVVYFDRRLQVLDIPGPTEPPREFLTQDKKNIEVAGFVCWRIARPLEFLRTVGTLEAAQAALTDITVAELGNVLAQNALSGLLSIDPAELKLTPLMERIRTACAAKAADQYGIELVDFRIKRLNFPEQNRRSVFERMRAERKRIATRYRSEGTEAAAKIRAQADQQRAEILAQADREARQIEGRAEAEATRIYAEAFGQDPEFYAFLRTLESYAKSLVERTTIAAPASWPYLKLLLGGPPPVEDEATEPSPVNPLAGGSSPPSAQTPSETPE